jgi:hypothetical protein
MIDPLVGYAHVDADFEPNQNLTPGLTVIKTGSGTGTVTSNPAGIDCGATCHATFPIQSRALITLTAQADPGWSFQAWRGCDSATAATCRVLLSSAGATVTANFASNAARHVITRVAGDGTRCPARPDCGDAGPATQAQVTNPQGLAFDALGDLYIADTSGNEVRVVAPDGTITRIAGAGPACTTAPHCGDGGAATLAALNTPGGVAVDHDRNVYVAHTLDNESV